MAWRGPGMAWHGMTWDLTAAQGTLYSLAVSTYLPSRVAQAEPTPKGCPGGLVAQQQLGAISPTLRSTTTDIPDPYPSSPDMRQAGNPHGRRALSALICHRAPQTTTRAHTPNSPAAAVAAAPPPPGTLSHTVREREEQGKTGKKKRDGGFGVITGSR